MKPRSFDTHVDNYNRFLNRLCQRVGLARGKVRADVVGTRITNVQVTLLPARGQPGRQGRGYRPCELSELFQSRLSRLMFLRYPYGSVEIQIAQSRIKQTFFSISARAHEKAILQLLFKPPPPRKRSAAGKEGCRARHRPGQKAISEFPQS